MNIPISLIPIWHHAGLSNLLASLCHTGRRIVLGHTLNTLWQIITKNLIMFKVNLWFCVGLHSQTSWTASGPWTTGWTPPQLLQYCWLYSLCCTLHLHDIFFTGNLYILILFPFLSPHPLPFGNHQSILCIYEFVSVLSAGFLCFLHSPYKQKKYLFFSGRLYFT